MRVAIISGENGGDGALLERGQGRKREGEERREKSSGAAWLPSGSPSPGKMEEREKGGWRGGERGVAGEEGRGKRGEERERERERRGG